MPNCKKCKKEIPEGSLYCNHCGAPQQRNKKKKMYQRPDGLFEQIKTINGKRVAFRGKTEKEVTDKMIQYQEEQEKGPLFREVAEKWWYNTVEEVEYNTAKGYQTIYNYSIERFGSQRIRNIFPSDIAAYIKHLASRGYAYKTVSNHLSVLRLIFDYAIANDIIQYNPTASISIPRRLPRSHREIASDKDIALICQNAENGLFGLLGVFCLYTGCRISEACAVRFKDIDRAAQTLTIGNAIYYEHNQPKLKSPKTDAGYRTVPLPPFLLDLIPDGKPNTFLFSKNSGKTALTGSQVRSGWEKYQKEIGITCTAHQLRHAYATLLYEAKIDEKTAQKMMGHADISTTIKIYTHIRESQMQLSQNIFRDFLSNLSA